jgi:hypothetical protein
MQDRDERSLNKEKLAAFFSFLIWSIKDQTHITTYRKGGVNDHE